MFDLFATVLAWFYELWPSYGMAIVFLTLTVMLILTPLTLKGTRSMMMLQRLAPELKKLQAQYKDDRQKLNEETLKFYRENQINPLGGCLPLLVQMPVFIVLYRVLSGLTKTSDGTFDPSYLDQASDLFKALDVTDEMVSWGMDLSRSATAAMQESFGHALPYLLLVFGVAATSYIQQKQVSGRNPNSVNPQQQMLLRLMPAFFHVHLPHAARGACRVLLHLQPLPGGPAAGHHPQDPQADGRRTRSHPHHRSRGRPRRAQEELLRPDAGRCRSPVGPGRPDPSGPRAGHPARSRTPRSRTREVEHREIEHREIERKGQAQQRTDHRQVGPQVRRPQRRDSRSRGRRQPAEAGSHQPDDTVGVTNSAVGAAQKEAEIAGGVG